MQAYIRGHEVEQLLSLYNALYGMSQSIRLQMDTIKGNEVTDDDILGMALPHRDFEDIPSYSQGVISDRTAKTALKYETSLNLEVQEALKEMREELLLIETVIAKLDIALSIISPIQKEIVTSRYCKGLKWDEIDIIINKDKYLMSVSAMKSRGREGVECITKVCRIGVCEFEKVVKLFS